MIIRINQPPQLQGKNRNPKHHYAQARLKRQWGELAAWSYKRDRMHENTLDPDDAPHDVRVALPMDRPQRADPHNYTSYEVAWIIDGLVSVGCLPGDRAEHVMVHDPVLYKRVVRNGVPTTPVIVAIDESLPLAVYE